MVKFQRPYQENLSLDSLLDKYIGVGQQHIPDQFQYYTYVCHLINSTITLPIVTPSMIEKRCNQLSEYKFKLTELLTRPKVEQRSDEWFALRSNLITASDFAQALGAGKFGNQKQFYKKKCGYDVEAFSHYIPPLKWGCMFEQLATNIYEMRQGTKIHEFGIIPHPTIKYFGASPDGISENGIMLEIKCPYKRKITGEIPEQYYYQIQGQLEVCDLDECDYLECGFIEYSGNTEFEEDTNCPSEQGIILEYSLKSEDNMIPHYKYSDILCYDHGDVSKYIHPSDTENRKRRQNDLKKWTLDQVSLLESLDDVANGDIIYRYWKLDVYNVVRVYRDKDFTMTKLRDLSHIWDKILQYRIDKDMYQTEVCCKRMTKAQQAANAEMFEREQGVEKEKKMDEEIESMEEDKKLAFDFLPDTD